MPTQPNRPRRCTLSVPGSSQKMMAKAATLTVDQVLLDLEDAVALDTKVEARATVIDALNQQRWAAHTVSLRINDVETPWCHDDIIDVVTQAGERLDTIVLTKTKSISDVRFVHLLLNQLERKLGLSKRIGIECLIEDVEGLMRVEEIAACSDRIETLIFGVGDYAASQQMQLASVGSTEGYAGDLWHYPRFKLTMACRANDIEPIDGLLPILTTPTPWCLKQSGRRSWAWPVSGPFIHRKLTRFNVSSRRHPSVLPQRASSTPPMNRRNKTVWARSA